MKTIKTRWGSYTVLVKGESSIKWKVKKLIIKAGKCISLQKHNFRSELWTVVSGRGYYKAGNEDIINKITEGNHIMIDKNELHQVKAITDMVIIEIQTGSEVIESDIERVSYQWKD